MDDEPDKKRLRQEMFSTGGKVNQGRTSEEAKEAFEQATANHPFINRSHYSILMTGDSWFYDGENNLVGMLVKKAFPTHICDMAAKLLRTGATRTSLRANVFGGEAPFSGIAGYYDYTGAAIEFKCRKTSFTCDVINQWKEVFPFMEYINELYKMQCPRNWEAQNKAIPDVVRIHKTVYSTITINQRFRTAKHTDAGDLDAGMGCLSCLEGNYDGLHLGMPDFGVCFKVDPGDAFFFNTHHFHCNTELERYYNPSMDWSRLTAVLYYRALLGESRCLHEYRRRLKEAKEQGEDVHFDEVLPTQNGVNLNRPAAIYPVELSPISMLLCARHYAHEKKAAACFTLLHEEMCKNEDLQRCLFGISLGCTGGVLVRDKDSLVPPLINVGNTEKKEQKFGGFSETRATEETISNTHHFFRESRLKEILQPQLVTLWLEARSKWLELVKRDWVYAVERNPSREDFTWANKGDMNSAFFELCDVAAGIKQHLLGKEKGTPAEENSFWLNFASHLFLACQEELKMPDTAMTMKKLNVKLKDYNFGGTRYFKDMPPDEQQRRLMRKKRIMEAAEGRSEDGSATSKRSNWLENDVFDYQTEDCPVDYKKIGELPPTEFFKKLDVLKFLPASVDTPAKSCKVLVFVGGWDTKDHWPHAELPKTFTDAHEKELHRVLNCKYLAKLLPHDLHKNITVKFLRELLQKYETQPKRHLPASETKPFGNVTVSVVYSESQVDVKEKYDVVVLQHVLSYCPSMEAARNTITWAQDMSSYKAALVVETDLDDRSQYVLPDEVRDAYLSVRKPMYQGVHAILSNGGKPLPPALRSLPELWSLTTNSGGTDSTGTYFFHESPANEVCILCGFPTA